MEGLPIWTGRHDRLKEAMFDPRLDWTTPIMVYGPTGSSKSLCTSYFFHAWAAEMWADWDFLLCARTMKQFNQVLGLYARQFGQFTGLDWRGKRTYFVQESLIGPPNRFHVALGSSERQAETVPGSTMAGVLVDEGPRMPERFVSMAVSRLRTTRGGKAVITGNPRGPAHWCYERYGKGKGEPYHFAFTPRDNPTLPADWAEKMRAVFPEGHQYDRMVLGLHVGASGVIYPNLRDALVPSAKRFGEPLGYAISADWASATVTHAVRWALFDAGVSCAVGEWHWDGEKRGQLSTREQAKRVVAALGDGVGYAVVDQSALAFRRELGRLLGSRRVLASEGGVDEGIQRVELALGHSVFIESGRCPRLVASMSNYSYDEVWAERTGEDRPLKDGTEHGADAARYHVWKRPTRRRVKVSDGTAKPRRL